jgi:hypothetical protein
MVESEEGMDFLDQFKNRFKDRKRTEERLKAERVAAMTPKQRGNRKPPKKQINFRATAETESQLDALAQHLGKSITDVIATAIDALAKAHLGRKR